MGVYKEGKKLESTGILQGLAGKQEEKTETWFSDQGRSKRVGKGFPSAADAERRRRVW